MWGEVQTRKSGNTVTFPALGVQGRVPPCPYRWPSGVPEAKITAGHRLKYYRTARSAFPAVGLDPAGPCRESGKTAIEWREMPSITNRPFQVVALGVADSQRRVLGPAARPFKQDQIGLRTGSGFPYRTNRPSDMPAVSPKRGDVVRSRRLVPAKRVSRANRLPLASDESEALGRDGLETLERASHWILDTLRFWSCSTHRCSTWCPAGNASTAGVSRTSSDWLTTC